VVVCGTRAVIDARIMVRSGMGMMRTMGIGGIMMGGLIEIEKRLQLLIAKVVVSDESQKICKNSRTASRKF